MTSYLDFTRNTWQLNQLCLAEQSRPVHLPYFSVICTDCKAKYEILPITSKLRISKSRKYKKESIRVWGFGWETDMISESKYQLNNSEVYTMFVKPISELHEHRAMLDNIYLLLAVPAAIGTGFANKVACHITDYAGQQASGALTHCQHCFDSCTRIFGCTTMYLSTVYCFRHVFRMIQTTEKYRQFL